METRLCSRTTGSNHPGEKAFIKAVMTLVFTAILLSATAPGYAFMTFHGAEPMSSIQSWPEELKELLNHEKRFAGNMGPLADWDASYSADTTELNAFLKKFAVLKDATLKIMIQKGFFTIKMQKYDGTDRSIIADWRMHIAEYYKGRPDEKSFEGKELLITVIINAEGQIDLSKLDIPLSLEVTADPKHQEIADKHKKLREDQGVDKDKDRDTGKAAEKAVVKDEEKK